MADAKLSFIVDLVNRTEAGFKEMYANLDAVSKQTENVTRGMKDAGLVGGAAFAGLTAATFKFVNAASSVEQAQVAFTTMLGSADKAKKMIEDLTDFASHTPFEITGIRDTAKQLLAMGIASDQLIPTMRVLGDISAGVSQPVERLAYVFGQVRSAGKLMGGDLMQFTQAGVPLLDALSKTLGKTSSEIKGMISNGQISFKDVAKALESMSNDGGQFAHMMEKQQTSYSAMTSNLNDNITKTSAAIGMTLLPALKDIVAVLTTVTQAVLKWTQAHPDLAKSLLEVALLATGFLTVVGGIAFIIPKVSAAFGILTWATGGVTAAIVAATGATGMLATAISVGVLGAFALIIIALMYGINKFNNYATTVGGWGNAITITLSKLKTAFIVVFTDIAKVIALVLNMIPGIDNAMHDTIASMEGAAASSAQMTALMSDAFKQQAEAASKSSSSIADSIRSIADGYKEETSTSKEATDAIKKHFEMLVDALRTVENDVRKVYDDMQKASDDYLKSTTSANEDYQTQIVDTVAAAKKKKEDLQVQMNQARQKDDNTSIIDLGKQMQEQDNILVTYASLHMDLDKQISDAKARLDMNELQRIAYDHTLKMKQLQDEFQQEQDQNLAKIIALNAQHEEILALTNKETQVKLLAATKQSEAALLQLANQKAGLKTWMDETTTMYSNYTTQVNTILAGLHSTGNAGAYSNPNMSFFTGARASGGPVQPGRTFLVGEKGPELFTPSTYGSIAANGSGGGVTIIISGNSFVGSEDIADKIGRDIMNKLKQTIKI